MRFAKGHKTETRARIVDAASKRFRRDGVAAAGIAGVMEDAGLTHGGFYAHFASKEELVREATVAALDATQARLDRFAPEGADWLESRIKNYLSPRHRDTPETGCAIAALAAELGRHSEATRAAVTAKLQETFARYAAHLPEDAPAPSHQAIAIFSLIVGALQLARAVSDPGLSAQILQSGTSAALRLAGRE